ncbi:MAG: hypothetical protein U0175_19750 [Caldilineaceae bacterium]
MKLEHFHFIAFIGLLFTLAVMLVACPTKLNQEPFANQSPATTATSAVFSDAVEIQWLAGSGSAAEHGWLDPVIDTLDINTEDCPSERLGTLAWVHNEQLSADIILQVLSTDWIWGDLRQATKALTHNDTNVYKLSVSHNSAHLLDRINRVEEALPPEDFTQTTHNSLKTQQAIDFDVNPIQDKHAHTVPSTW